MKTIFTTIVLLFFTVLIYAQDKIYVHDATVSNTSGSSGHITYINHPDLNGNPVANIVFCQNWNPNGSAGVYNDNPTGLWYDSSVGFWAIYNENLAAMPVGASFNIYIADDSDVFTHIADASNIISNTTDMDNPDITEFSYLFFSNYFNPNDVYNPNTYGSWWTGSVRSLYIEDSSINVPVGAAFKIMRANNVSSTLFTHISTTTNIIGNGSIIDHPLLNGNPNATFLYSHYWGLGGTQNEVYLPHNTGIYYNGISWVVFTQDLTPFPENIVIDIVIADQEMLSTEDFDNTAITIFPNPVINEFSIQSQTPLEGIKIYNMLGQVVFEKQLDASNEKVDLSKLVTGQYIAKITSLEGVQTNKIIKK